MSKTVTYQGSLSFDPSRAVDSESGLELQDFVDQVFGSTQAEDGSLPVSGAFVLSDAGQPTESNFRAAGRVDAIRSAEITIGDTTVTANIPEINAASDSSDKFFGVADDGGFSFAQSEQRASEFVSDPSPVSNLIGAFNNTEVTIETADGTFETVAADGLSAFLGNTEIDNEFRSLETEGLGTTRIDDVPLNLLATDPGDGRDFSDIPSRPRAVSGDDVASSNVSLDLEGDATSGGLILEGSVDRWTIDESPLNIPSTAFVPQGFDLGDVLDFSGKDIESVRIFSSEQGSFLGESLQGTNNGFVPVEQLDQLSSSEGRYFAKTFSSSEGTSDWHRFRLKESDSGVASSVSVADTTVPADQSVSLDRLLDTENLAEDAQVQLFYEGQNFGFLERDELGGETLTLPGDGETANVWLNMFASGEGRSGWSRTEIKGGDDDLITAVGGVGGESVETGVDLAGG